MNQLLENIKKNFPQTVRAKIVQIEKTRPDEKNHLAYVSLSEPFKNLANKEEQKTQLWSRIFDIKYKQSKINMPEQQFDTGVWQNSYNGKMIDDIQMKEWVASSIQKLTPLCHSKTRVLEIGCGTGLIMFPILNLIGEYVGIDGSDEVIQKLKSNPSIPSNKTKFYRADANQVDALDIGKFDLVILHSVVQYFPSADYLLQTINKLEKILSPNSVVFIGDIRSFPLRRYFYADILLSHPKNDFNIQQLKNEVDTADLREKETLLHPLFFRRLSRVFPWISSAQTQMRSGVYLNEMNMFRYDVMIRCNQTDIVSDDHSIQLKWDETIQKDPFNIVDDSKSLILTGIPNERLKHLTFLKDVFTASHLDTQSVRDLSQKVYQHTEKVEQYQLQDLKSKLEKYYPHISIEPDLEDETCVTLVCSKNPMTTNQQTLSYELPFDQFSNHVGIVDSQSDYFKDLHAQQQPDHSIQAIIHLDQKMFDLMSSS